MNPFRTWYDLLRGTFAEFSRDKCSRLGAALAFYILMSLAPMLLLVIGVAGLMTGTDTAREQVVEQSQELVGPEGAETVKSMLKHGSSQTGGIISTVVGLVLMVVASTGVFVQLQDSLNTVWNVPERKTAGLGIWRMIRSRLLSFSVVLALGFLLLVSLVLGAVLSGLKDWLSARFGLPAAGLEVLNLALSFVLSTLLFALIFKVLPDAHVSWRGVWVGAVVTAVLFNLGKYLIGLYLGHAAVGSSFGAAGSLVVLLVWVYYSSQLLLLGAEFTQVYATRMGSGMKYRTSAEPTPTPTKF
jgi:membrane protein